MNIKHFDAYSTISDLEDAINEFSSQAEIIDVKYQTIYMNGEQQFTAVATYNCAEISAEKI